MKKFVFKLEKLHSLRQKQEKDCKEELAKALAEADQILSKLEGARRERDETEKKLRQIQESTNDSREISEYFHYLDLMGKKLANIQDEVIKSQNEVTVKRQNLQEALQKRKVLDNIKEKKYSLWEKEYSKLEAALLDEVATTRYHRNQTEKKSSSGE